MSKNLAIALSNFQTGSVSKKELEEVIEGLVEADSPERSIVKFEYTDDGVIVSLDDGSKIEIDIDWDEIVIN